jgi:hypothetical protein
MRFPAGLALLLLVVTAPVSAQTVETDPVQCWWRATATAVRVGQPFAVVLTCSVVETSTVIVVPDQGPLDPMVTQMPPFEVLGGTHHADLRTTDHRFFQYEYRLRFIGEDAFGKDVELPALAISYHLQTRTGDGPAIEGRELMYNLAPMTVRVLSLVPADDTSIRDATAQTFGEVESGLFRANALRTTALVLFGLAGLGGLIAIVRLFGGLRRKTAADTGLLPDVAILRGLRKELAAVDRERRVAGWTPALIGRLATALRVAALYAMSRPVIQVAFIDGSDSQDRLVVSSGWPRPRKVVVSGSATPTAIRRQRGDQPSELLDGLERALDRVTIRQYGRTPGVEDHELDTAVEAGERAVREMTRRHTWLRRTLAGAERLRTPVGQRA